MDKRAGRAAPEDDRMTAARREYKALLEAQAAAGKGGRPKKNTVRSDESPADAEDASTDE